MGYTASIGTNGRLSATERISLLELPDGAVEIVIDTDTYNEIDGQFALAYAFFSPPIDVRAVYAAPFENRRSSGPEDGLERSYDEIVRLLEHPGPHGITHREVFYATLRELKSSSSLQYALLEIGRIYHYDLRPPLSSSCRPSRN